VLRALGLKASAGIAGHGTEFRAGPYTVLNSYHCSRLNTNTGRLTAAMFEAVFERAKALLGSLDAPLQGELSRSD
jgi:uracil-DNA glycosylase